MKVVQLQILCSNPSVVRLGPRAASMRNHLFWLCIHFCHLPHHSYLNLVIIAVVGHKKKNLWTPRVSSYRLLSLTANDNHENLFWPSMYFWQSDCLRIASVGNVATMRLRSKYSHPEDVLRVRHYGTACARHQFVIFSGLSHIVWYEQCRCEKRRASNTLHSFEAYVFNGILYTARFKIFDICGHVVTSTVWPIFPNRLGRSIHILWLFVVRAYDERRRTTRSRTIRIFKRKHRAICKGLNADLHSAIGGQSQCSAIGKNDIRERCQCQVLPTVIESQMRQRMSESVFFVVHRNHRSYAFSHSIFHVDFLFLFLFLAVSLSLSLSIARM